MSATTTEFRNMETGSAPEGPGPDGECGGGRRHALNFAALNEAVLYKELFLAYLGAALIEPVLAIAGMEEAEGASLVINAVTLLAICWWMWIITDAFDFSDVMQAYKYRIDFGDKVRGGGFDWIALGSDDRAARRRGVAGDLQRNFMLWFMIASIIAAWIPGTIQHRDVMHAYVILLLWTLMHHTCRRATSWGRRYVNLGRLFRRMTS